MIRHVLTLDAQRQARGNVFHTFSQKEVLEMNLNFVPLSPEDPDKRKTLLLFLLLAKKLLSPSEPQWSPFPYGRRHPWAHLNKVKAKNTQPQGQALLGTFSLSCCITSSKVAS